MSKIGVLDILFLIGLIIFIEKEKDKEIERLNNIINKAIEYIKEHTILYTSYLGKPKVVPKIELQREAYDKLLEILKGEDKE